MQSLHCLLNLATSLLSQLDGGTETVMSHGSYRSWHRRPPVSPQPGHPSGESERGEMWGGRVGVTNLGGCSAAPPRPAPAGGHGEQLHELLSSQCRQPGPGTPQYNINQCTQPLLSYHQPAISCSKNCDQTKQRTLNKNTSYKKLAKHFSLQFRLQI